MSSLFLTKLKDLHGFFETITVDDIKDCSESKVYHRGREYYDSGCVTEASYNKDKVRLKTIVEGNSVYTVTITLQKGQVYGECTCPYGGGCKHVIASLLFAIEQRDIEIIPDAKSPGIDIDRYLQSLSKSELISLVKEFAPDQFKLELNNKFSDGTTAQDIFRKVKRNIEKIFKGEDCLYNPFAFDAALEKEIKKLSGLETNLRKEIEDLLFFIMNEVQNAFDEGYLYSHYDDYNYEPSESFNEFVANFVKCLDFLDKTAFLTRLDGILGGQSYDTYSDLRQLSEKVFPAKDLPYLKEMLVSSHKNISQHLIESYYERLRHLLTEKEKGSILAEIQNKSIWVIELARIFDSQNRVTEAIDTIKNWLANTNGFGEEEIYGFYLDLHEKAGFNLSAPAKEAVSRCSTCSMLQKIVTMTNKELPDYELILEQKASGQLLEYLEMNGRLPEALALLQRNKRIGNTQVFNFYKKHKKIFPSDAERYFIDEINRNLEFTGDNYYHIIADHIQQLKQISRLLADKYLLDIRQNYKRRRNLISILSNH